MDNRLDAIDSKVREAYSAVEEAQDYHRALGHPVEDLTGPLYDAKSALEYATFALAGYQPPDDEE